MINSDLSVVKDKLVPTNSEVSFIKRNLGCLGIVLIICVGLGFLYTQVIRPDRIELSVVDQIDSRWDIEIDTNDKLITTEETELGWQGDKQRYTVFQLEKPVQTYIEELGLSRDDMYFKAKEDIQEIERTLSINSDNLIDFDSNYFYSIRMKNNGVETFYKKVDLLYIVLVEEDDKPIIYFVEDIATEYPEYNF